MARFAPEKLKRDDVQGTGVKRTYDENLQPTLAIEPGEVCDVIYREVAPTLFRALSPSALGGQVFDLVDPVVIAATTDIEISWEILPLKEMDRKTALPFALIRWFLEMSAPRIHAEDCALDKESVLAHLEELRQFERNWDGYQADPINFQIIAAARRFIESLPDDLITTPQVVPMTRGRLQFEWHLGERSLELEFETPTQIHYLKCDDSRGIEEEQILPLTDRQSILELLRWFMSE